MVVCLSNGYSFDKKDIWNWLLLFIAEEVKLLWSSHPRKWSAGPATQAPVHSYSARARSSSIYNLSRQGYIEPIERLWWYSQRPFGGVWDGVTVPMTKVSLCILISRTLWSWGINYMPEYLTQNIIFDWTEHNVERQLWIENIPLFKISWRPPLIHFNQSEKFLPV